MADDAVVTLRQRLVAGQDKLTKRHDQLLARDDAGVGTELETGFLEWNETWVALEAEARIRGMQGCVHPDGATCPDDAVVRCLWCAGLLEDVPVFGDAPPEPPAEPGQTAFPF